jgi:phosphoglycolate phosphatase-like HAD superfamily hydrolase
MDLLFDLDRTLTDDVEAAHANGLPAAGVLWGYGSRSELEAAGAGALLDSVEDLIAWTRREPPGTDR